MGEVILNNGSNSIQLIDWDCSTTKPKKNRPMGKIIKQLTIIIAGGALALSFGCGLDTELSDWLNDKADEFKDEITAFAPDLIDGKTAHMSIMFGSGESPTTGSFTITYSTTTYSLADTGGTMTNETGTYSYDKTASNQATIVHMSDGDSGTISLTFLSHTSGNYSYVNTVGSAATQTGTFILN